MFRLAGCIALGCVSEAHLPREWDIIRVSIAFGGAGEAHVPGPGVIIRVLRAQAWIAAATSGRPATQSWKSASWAARVSDKLNAEANEPERRTTRSHE